MFFKNILLYRLTEPFVITSEDLHNELGKNLFFPCPKSENFSYGWVSPFGQDHELLVHSIDGCHLFTFCREEKILPSTVIRDELQKKITQIETSEDRKVYRKEKNSLREQIIINLRQQAFSRKRRTHVYIDTRTNWLLIDTSSRNRAEEICSLLRKTLGSLKLALPGTADKPEIIMTQWLLENVALTHFDIENDCYMLDPKQKSSTIKFQQLDLNTKEIINHLHSGKQIVKLAMRWGEKISFEFCNDLTIKKIRFLNVLDTQHQEMKNRSSLEQLDADFALMAGEFSQFLQQLFPLFGGLEFIDNHKEN